jgi:hypothetical protein
MPVRQWTACPNPYERAQRQPTTFEGLRQLSRGDRICAARHAQVAAARNETKQATTTCQTPIGCGEQLIELTQFGFGRD